MDIYSIILIIAVSIIFISKRSKYALHMVQLEGYIPEDYKRWLDNNKDKAYSLKENNQPIKKPLTFTQRARRLYNTNIVLNIIILLVPSIIYLSFDRIMTIYIYGFLLLIFGYILYKIQPLIMYISTIIIKPVEDKINMGFYVNAQEKIKARDDLNVIGITGSFGKTSTKFIVSTILSQKLNVLTSPESYNTPMGLSKVINNDLNQDHEVFVAELGARLIGEIREVAVLVQPKIGIITNIGPAHIETFKNIENIMKTKYELIDELPTDGVAIFNYDNEYIKKLADKTFKEKILYGLEDTDSLNMYADNIVVSQFGSTFTLKDDEGNSVECKTKLLGKHNIYNILAGACVAKVLGFTFDEISFGISKTEPVDHRLNIINPGTGIIIIDDAFNSNPIGTKAALDVLSQFKEGKKIIVTPGMIELGEMEESANREFGVNIGKVCDYVILVGEKRTEPIYEGLMETNFNKDNIFIVNNLEEASEQIGKIARPKDVVLFENDLPDNYTE
ncbi:MAG: UDP-N-acetylmuramoyl-tripeptide--D-alanyl-D-alanine ligase [Tissierellia bacterium]|nr:UDP-N-acetylmuramoyl-tripeptide--D-alanyl-D-alanine ligase [Tissierellia bacterium]